MGLDLTSFDGALKEYYDGPTVQNMVYKNNPLFALVPKQEDFFGRNNPQPIIYGNPQSRSSTFARAQARSLLENSRIKEFLVTRIKDYAICTIDNETIEASKSDKGAFLEAATVEINGIIQSLTRSAAQKMYRSGYGAIGTIGSFSTTTITLAVTADIVNFEIGQELDLAANEGSGTLRAYGSSSNGLIVTGVNRATGVLTFGFNVNDATNGIPTIANADSIFIRGDRHNSATPSLLSIAGLEAWIPFTSPTSTTFFGVDRSVDPTRLGGQRYDGSLVPIEEALINAAALCAREGGSPDHFFVGFDKYTDIEKALGSKVQYTDLKVGDIGFRALRVNGPAGEIKVIPDQNCPFNRGYMLQLDTWVYKSLGKAIRIFDTDGLTMLRQQTADGVEVRAVYYSNLMCNAPGYNCCVKL